MYRCLDCGEIFAEPKKGATSHYEVDTRQYEPEDVCPYCGHDEFEEVILCPWCEENYIVEGGEYFCDDCYARVSSLANELADEKQKSFDEAKDLIGVWLER
jgi:DNA-directed RNA polymerase subunit RPC12/RpoP